ncbi:probable PDA1 - pyruvate dehydrogenase (lipoamide) alpha chain precursor [Melanopsichium pennsylvanicum]|uniref:Pyruvate dehydrogenase E1 component subunit alpha n=2 Tax=Melanopsichium pennsylvanicum TaxID=63383 RepID=A0AAJ4XNP4_9BASI|nr:probable PDA1-pyruvate dehydrogenase (lipoamide) alpha chain precursor [Melanopsichium pennsylvanicum 4]SNX85137.1 probable PDA1 - pyruvate dehydrogenase (lipoamide) alpha chain precursor [Melanopsichium pennsylvanicum]
MVSSLSRNLLRTAGKAKCLPAYSRNAIPSSSRFVQLTAEASRPQQELPASKSEKFKVDLNQDSFKGYKFDVPKLEWETSKDDLVNLYSQMVKMRRMEMAADQLYKQKLIRGFCHLAIGQEAVAVGMEAGMKPSDKLITAYRCHPFTVQKGGSIKSVIAELFGREAGISKGKGGSMHMFTPTFFGGNGIVGAQVPVGAGIAFAQQYMNTNDATFAMYGDGASNQGQVFEAYNMSKLWNLPCVFVCENNKYGMGTSAERSSMNTQYYTRGDVIPGLQVNAMDVLAVAAATKHASDFTLGGNGPLLMELVTYRYGGHSLSDPGTTYRTRDEIQTMRSSSDPIQGLKTRMLDWGVVEEAELKRIDKAAKEEVDQAVEEAKQSPQPKEDTLWTDIYYPGTEPDWMRGRDRTEIHRYR